MKGHSIEPTIFVPKNPERFSIQAHDCFMSAAGFYPKKETTHKPALRRCQSASSLARNPLNPHNQRIHGIETKYKILEESYRRLLNEAQVRNEIFSKQRSQMEKLLQTTMKEQKEIERLRQMIRINEKQSKTIATEKPYEDHSWRKRMEVSTGESELNSQTRCDHSHNRKTIMNKQRSSLKRNPSLKGLEKQKTKMTQSRINKGNGKESPNGLKKYKFIPTLSFKHN